MNATITTKKGKIVIQLFPDLAPNTVANFVNKAKAGFYDGLKWHRVEDWVVQGGDPKGNGTGGGNMTAEYNDGKFTIGAVGIARGGDKAINNDSQFFITKKDSQFLNGDYTYFGQVTQGQNIANMLTSSDKIQSISIEE